MRRTLLTLVVTLSFVAVACGGGSSSGSNATGASGASGTPTMVAITTEPTSGAVSTVMTPDEGGTITVTLADGDSATLAVPADALESETSVTLVPVRVADGVGVDIQPAGLWLDRAAKLTFGRTPRAILVRAAPAREADRFSLAGTDRASVSIIRFRPVLALGAVPKGLTPPAAAAAPGAGYRTEPGVYAFPHDPRPDDVDAIDQVAEEMERATDDGTGQQPDAPTGAAIRRAAAVSAAEQAAKCDDRTSAAASRIADTLQTAGSAAADIAKPNCVRRVVQVVARMEGNFASGGMSFEVASMVSGHGTFDASVGTETPVTFPLEGQEEGVAQLTSFGGGAMDSAFAMLGGGSAPPPDITSCRSTPLENGSMTGTARLADGTIDLVLQPSGSFTVTCDSWGPFTHEPIVWAVLTGGGLSIPITDSIPDGRNVVHVLGQIVQSDEIRAGGAPNGTVTVSESGSTISISLTIGVFWSRADRCQLTAEEKAKGPAYEQQMCGPGNS